MMFPLNTVDNFEKYKSPTGDFYWTDTILASELAGEKNRYEVIKKTVESLMFMFGWKDFNWNIMNNYYKGVNVFTSL